MAWEPLPEDPYKLALEKAESDLANAIQERDKWTLELVRLEHLTQALSVMIGKSNYRGFLAKVSQEVGFQEVVLTCVRQSPEPMTAVDVRDSLTSIGYDLSKFKNPLAVIHGALKRLAAAKQIEETNGAYKSAHEQLRNIRALGELMKSHPPADVRPTKEALRDALVNAGKKK